MAINAAAFDSAVKTAFDMVARAGTFTHADTSVTDTVKVLIRELGTSELVADYRQGDLECLIHGDYLTSRPMKYDTLIVGGRTYTVKDSAYSPRTLGDDVQAYKFIVRGG